MRDAQDFAADIVWSKVEVEEVEGDAKGVSRHIFGTRHCLEYTSRKDMAGEKIRHVCTPRVRVEYHERGKQERRDCELGAAMMKAGILYLVSCDDDE